MQLKFLYALSLLLCLTTFASSNECADHCHRTRASAPAAPTVKDNQEAVIQYPLLRLLSI